MSNIFLLEIHSLLNNFKELDFTKTEIINDSIQYIYIYIYIRSPMGIEHSGEGILGCRTHNAKLFERIEHWYPVSYKCK